MLVRFVVLQKDGSLHVEQGIIRAAGALHAGGQLAEKEERLVCAAFDWFNRRLPHPDRLARAGRPHAQARAVSWFKDTAREFIARMEELAAVLEAHGHAVQRLTTDRPGYVVYEDDYQVVAEPFRGKKAAKQRYRRSKR